VTDGSKTMLSTAIGLVAATLMYTAFRPLISSLAGVAYWLCLCAIAAFVLFVVRPRRRWQSRALMVAVGTAALLALVAWSDHTANAPAAISGS
jgi:hypothetical protein